MRPPRREHGNQAGQAYNAQGTLSVDAQSTSRIRAGAIAGMGQAAQRDLNRAQPGLKVCLKPCLKPWRLFFTQRHFRAIFQGVAPAGPTQNSQNCFEPLAVATDI
ncbi:hypothetical protein JQ636_03510 [Bradyrhizobium japonicum]|uniref:hypothetical protein n=1 Tax=Bradyrhizobium japonicum TaxID=375 RepID=UPI001BA7A852|nr:hypothetical protein [Bradyrhizobium japonicum]MBR0728459.1 hypothetical protein [Bradyrhizobium japonicum]MBR0802595.1 hypothetical protein [Bradyrhizobium japonicum]